jgi:hypothetical protein
MLWVKCNDIVVTTVINHGSKKAEAGNNVLRDDLIAYLQQSDTSKRCIKPIISKHRNTMTVVTMGKNRV